MRLRGLASAIAASVVSWNRTKAGTPVARAVRERHVRSASRTAGSALLPARPGGRRRPAPAAVGRLDAGPTVVEVLRQPSPEPPSARSLHRRLHRLQVRRRRAAERPRAEAAALGPRGVELAPGPRDRHVEQSPLLGPGVGRLGVADGHQPLLEPGQEHDLPLQALGRMEGGEHHPSRPGSGSSPRSVARRPPRKPEQVADGSVARCSRARRCRLSRWPAAGLGGGGPRSGPGGLLLGQFAQVGQGGGQQAVGRPPADLGQRAPDLGCSRNVPPPRSRKGTPAAAQGPLEQHQLGVGAGEDRHLAPADLAHPQPQRGGDGGRLLAVGGIGSDSGRPGRRAGGPASRGHRRRRTARSPPAAGEPSSTALATASTWGLER